MSERVVATTAGELRRLGHADKAGNHPDRMTVYVFESVLKEADANVQGQEGPEVDSEPDAGEGEDAA